MGKLIRNTTPGSRDQWMELAELSSFRACELARHLGLSQRQVERYTRRQFTLTPQQWLRRMRMEKARELIPVMDSVKEVAYSLGFKQSSHFCREFKAHFGVTCSEYASSLRFRSDEAGADSLQNGEFSALFARRGGK